MAVDTNIHNLQKLVDKNPKSLLFARLADELRIASHVQGYEKEIDKALTVVNKGLAANRNFLPGMLARGRILLEKGDFTSARIDFEAVAEKDPFCISAQKLLLETLNKLEQQPKTEIYAKILNILDDSSSESPIPAPAPVLAPTPEPTPEPTPVSASVSASLDNILLEEENKENETSNLLLQTFENIFEKQAALAPVSSLPEATSIFEKTTNFVPPTAPNLDDIISEQLASKVDDIPDLTSDMDSLLATATPVAESPATPNSPAAPNLDDILTEQLASKVDNIPDLTGDMDSLLATAMAEAEPELMPYVPSQVATPNLDDIISEQLASKVDDIPDLTKDMDSLLNPTSTLAELYMDQGLPEKATEVYKELLVLDSGNTELQKKLEQAEALI